MFTRPNPYFGCVVGRVGNRISGGKFNLDGVEYQLAKNDGENSIHGGIKVSCVFIFHIVDKLLLVNSNELNL